MGRGAARRKPDLASLFCQTTSEPRNGARIGMCTFRSKRRQIALERHKRRERELKIGESEAFRVRKEKIRKSTKIENKRPDTLQGNGFPEKDERFTRTIQQAGRGQKWGS